MTGSSVPGSGSTHSIVYESRSARCCTSHRERWAVCSCGWEAGERLAGDLVGAITGHRLTVIEQAIGVAFRFGDRQ